MKCARTSLLAAAIMFLLAACGGPTLYTSPKFDSYRQNHKLICILPLKVTIDPHKLPKDYTMEMAQKAESEEGYNMQRELYTRFLNRQQKGEYTIDFQDIDKTNALLTKAGVPYEKMADMTKEEICKIVGTDAAISGSIYRERPMSTGLAVGLGLLLGVWGNTNKVNVTIAIHEGGSGELVWQYDHEASGSVGSSAEKMAESLVKNVSKKFPYKKAVQP
ncbi:MAG: hypothetical protein WAU88_11795 [Candidatus Zixiibacteriota bacterium]